MYLTKTGLQSQLPCRQDTPKLNSQGPLNHNNHKDTKPNLNVSLLL